jgi:hypothetical protein
VARKKEILIPNTYPFKIGKRKKSKQVTVQQGRSRSRCFSQRGDLKSGGFTGIRTLPWAEFSYSVEQTESRTFDFPSIPLLI